MSLKHFNSEYSIISVVGNDFKSQDLKLLESCGVDISGIKIEENDKTFYWSCIYTDNFKERITTKTELILLMKIQFIQIIVQFRFEYSK